MSRIQVIEILIIEGCPHAELALARARLAVVASGCNAELLCVVIENAEQALVRRFLGSPTVRVDGRDVDREARERSSFGLQCRVYAMDGRFDGAPPMAWIHAALMEETDARP